MLATSLRLIGHRPCAGFTEFYGNSEAYADGNEKEEETEEA